MMNNITKLVLFIFLSYLFFNTAFAREKVLPKSYSIPKEQIFYTSIFDTVCANKTGYKIDPTWIQELSNRLPHWRKMWNEEGTLLLATTIKLIDRPFSQKSFQVSLSLCTFPSMSAPLIINTRYVLRSFISHPISDFVFISNIYHEVLHNYINSFLPKNTPLLLKYKNESKGVLNHLHLFALEKAVYLKLGWHTKLNEIITKDYSLPNDDYKHAWEIVNRNKNYEKFINELKSFNKSKEINPKEI